MSRHLTVTASAVICILLATSAALVVADTRPRAPVAAAALAPAAGITLPLDASLPGVGTFSGVLRITRFAVVDNAVVAVGLIIGTLVDDVGNITSIIKNVSIPVSLPLSAPSSIKTSACVLPTITMGPLDLTLLGMPIHINQVMLDISSVPGAGAALDSLLCTINQLLGSTGTMLDLVSVLNQLLGALGG